MVPYDSWRLGYRQTQQPNKQAQQRTHTTIQPHSIVTSAPAPAEHAAEAGEENDMPMDYGGGLADVHLPLLIDSETPFHGAVGQADPTEIPFHGAVGQADRTEIPFHGAVGQADHTEIPFHGVVGQADRTEIPFHGAVGHAEHIELEFHDTFGRSHYNPTDSEVVAGNAEQAMTTFTSSRADNLRFALDHTDVDGEFVVTPTWAPRRLTGRRLPEGHGRLERFTHWSQWLLPLFGIFLFVVLMYSGNHRGDRYGAWAPGRFLRRGARKSPRTTLSDPGSQTWSYGLEQPT